MSYRRVCNGCGYICNDRSNWSRHTKGKKGVNPCPWYKHSNTQNIVLPNFNPLLLSPPVQPNFMIIDSQNNSVTPSPSNSQNNSSDFHQTPPTVHETDSDIIESSLETDQSITLDHVTSKHDDVYTSDELKVRADYFAVTSIRYWIKLVGNSQTGCNRPWIAMKMNKEFLEKEGITDPEHYDWSTSPYGWIRWWPGFKVDPQFSQVYASLDEDLEERYWSRETTPENSPPNSPRNSNPSIDISEMDETKTNSSPLPSQQISMEAKTPTTNGISSTTPITTLGTPAFTTFEFRHETGPISKFKTSVNTVTTYSDSNQFKSNLMDCDNITFEKDIWMSLIEKIPCGRARNLNNGCPGKLEYFDHKSVGEVITMTYKCGKCGNKVQYNNVHNKRIKSGKGIGIESANLKIVIAYILKGTSWEQYMAERNLDAHKLMGREVWERCERFIYLHLSQIYSKHMADIQKEMKEKGKGLILSGDGAWRIRRDSPNGVYVIMDATTGKVIYQFIMSKKAVRQHINPGGEKFVQIGESNYEGTSKGMEGYGFRSAMNALEDMGILSLVTGYVCDQDSSVLSQFKNEIRFLHISLYHDGGHAKKNFSQDLDEIIGKSKDWKDYTVKISKWFLSCLMASRAYAQTFGDIPFEQKKEIMKENCVRRLKYWRSHYTQSQCNEGCPCYYSFIRTVPTGASTNLVSWLPLPEELQKKIQGYLIGDITKNESTVEQKVIFYKLTSFDRVSFSFRREKNDTIKLLPKVKPKWIDENKKVRKNMKTNTAKLDQIEGAINKLIANIDVFIHFWSTCLLESFNASRVKLVPKDKPLIKYWRQKCELSALIWNLGKEEVVRLLYQSLNIEVSPSLELRLKRQEHKKEMERVRHAGISFKKRAKQLANKAGKQREKELALSKERRDEYTANSKKSTLNNLTPRPPASSFNSTPPTATASATTALTVSSAPSRKRKRDTGDFDPANLTGQQVEDLVGGDLKSAMNYFKLKIAFNGDGSVGGQRKRLKQVVSEVDAKGKYPTYFRNWVWNTNLWNGFISFGVFLLF